MFMKLSSITRITMTVLLIVAIILLPGTGESASFQNRASNGCAEKLSQAQEKYTLGLFREASELISPCAEESEASTPEKVAAYRLLALIYIAEDSLDAAGQAVRTLLRLEPQFQPDPIDDPPPFAKLVEDLRREMIQPAEEEPPTNMAEEEPLTNMAEETEQPEDSQEGSTALRNRVKKWMLLGAGVLVATGTLALLVSGGGGDEGTPPGSNDLPIPPDLP